jgi:hypothetical protein
MPTVRKLLAFPLALITLAASPAFAGEGQHIVAPGDVSAVVAGSVAKQDADRRAVAEALARPEVREVAAKIGVDINDVAAIASTMSGDQLTRAAEAAQQVNTQLSGGATTVVISVTTIIIVLLLIILLVVALK